MRRKNYHRFLVFIVLALVWKLCLPLRSGTQAYRGEEWWGKDSNSQGQGDHISLHSVSTTPWKWKGEAGLVSQTYEWQNQGPEFKWFVQGQNIGSDKWTLALTRIQLSFLTQYRSTLVLRELPKMTTGEGMGKALRNDMAEATIKIQELGFYLTKQPGAFFPGNKRE